MRLTLRTLLAWMDGVLPPDAARQLGEQVDASPVARKLVERIGAVVENDRIAAPRLNARGLAADANSVAEYLDNTLAAERLEAFETICLESDVHLAEVAACHAMLAEVARDPATVEPLDAGRRRALMESIEQRIKAHPEVILGGAAAPAARPGGEGPREPARSRGHAGGGGVTLTPVAAEPATPTRRRRTPWGAWGVFAASLLLLAGLAAFFVRSAGLFQAPADVAAGLQKGAEAPPIEPGAEVAAIPPADAVAAVEAVEGTEPAPGGIGAVVAPPDGNGAEARIDTPPVTVAAAGERGNGAADGGMDDPAAVETTPAETDPGAAAPADPDPAAAPEPGLAQGPAKVPAGEALAIAAGVRKGRPAPPRAPEKPDMGVADDVGLEGPAEAGGIGFVSADGALLARVADGDLVRWTPLGVGTPFAAGAEVVVPPGMRPEVNLGGLSIRLEPRSVVRFDVDADGTPQVDVVAGRLVARAAGGDARIGIRAGALAGRIVAGLEGGVAVESGTDWQRGSGGREVATIVRVAPVARPLRWTGADGDPAEATTLPARSVLGAVSSAPGEATLAERDGPAPDWIAGGARIDALERGAAETFLRRLGALPAGDAPADGLGRVLESMAVDRRVENRIFAAVTLALLGDYRAAAELLAADVPGRKLEPRQWAALEAAVVPLALERGPDSEERLRRAWEDHGPPGRAELLMAMGRGPTDDDLAAGADRTLVDALGDASLVVRRYALAVLADVTRPATFDRARYRPDAPDEARREGVAWWRTQMEKGLLRRAR